jgi:hypothetical protein
MPFYFQLSLSLLAPLFVASAFAQGHAGTGANVDTVAPPVAAILQRLSSVPYLSDSVADTHNGANKLKKSRSLLANSVDSCRAPASKDSFLGAIEEGVRQSTVDRIIETNPKIESLFGMGPMNDPQRAPASLLSNPICEMTTEDIGVMLDQNSIPSPSAVDTLAKFTEASNADRVKALAGDQAALQRFTHRWTNFMGCLSYAESMGSPESAQSDRKFEQILQEFPEAAAPFTNAAGRVVRPAGVLAATDRDGAYYNQPRALDALLAANDRQWALKAADLFFLGKVMPLEEITVFRNRIFTKDVVHNGRVLAKAMDPLTAEKLAELDAQGVLDVSAGTTKGVGDALLAHLKEARLSGAAGSAETKRLAKEYVSNAYPTWQVVGMYQFDPNAAGNVSPCILQWNKIHADNPACFIDPASTNASIVALASGGQTFNAFCGAQKIVQAFNSQINTRNTTGTPPHNVQADGSLKAPKDRCVSVVARAGENLVYAHFGPLRNSTKTNLAAVLNCAKRVAR